MDKTLKFQLDHCLIKRLLKMRYHHIKSFHRKICT